MADTGVLPELQNFSLRKQLWLHNESLYPLKTLVVAIMIVVSTTHVYTHS